METIWDIFIIAASVLTPACALIAVKLFLAGGLCQCKTLMNGKTVLITGSNTGIGKETARDLARRGARVILACRNKGRAERAADDIRISTGNEDVVVYMLDLASLESVRQCARDVLNKESRLDVLINNAGIVYLPTRKLTKDGFEMIFGTNHLGHFLFTNLLLELVQKSEPSRIVNVSSIGHRRGRMRFDDLNSEKEYAGSTAYKQSKLANVLFTRELSKRLQGTGVTANSLHPGVVATDIVRFKDDFSWPVRWFINIIYYGVAKHLMKTPHRGAQSTIHCAVDPNLERTSGKYFSDCVIKKEATRARDDEAAARLWTMSEDMVRL